MKGNKLYIISFNRVFSQRYPSIHSFGRDRSRDVHFVGLYKNVYLEPFPDRTFRGATTDRTEIDCSETFLSLTYTFYYALSPYQRILHMWTLAWRRHVNGPLSAWAYELIACGCGILFISVSLYISRPAALHFDISTTLWLSLHSARITINMLVFFFAEWGPTSRSRGLHVAACPSGCCCCLLPLLCV